MAFKKITSFFLATLALAACSDVEINDPAVSNKDCYRPAKKAKAARRTADMIELSIHQRALNVVIRDFDVTHPDFENFQEEAWASLKNSQLNINDVNDQFNVNETAWKNGTGDLTTWIFPGYEVGSEWFTRRSDYGSYGCGTAQTPELGIAVGQLGYPHDVISPSGVSTTTPSYIHAVADQSGYEWYGEFSYCEPDPVKNPIGLTTMRGLASDLCADQATTALWDAKSHDNGKCVYLNWTKKTGNTIVAVQQQEFASENGFCLPRTDATGRTIYPESLMGKTCDGTKVCKTHSWSQIVYVTPGMVGQHLVFDPALLGTKDYVHEPAIVKNRSACDNGYFEQWFRDVPGVNKSSNMQLVLNEDPSAPGYFEIDKNWNNGGFFPLDSIGMNYNRIGTPAAFNSDSATFGPQSLSIYCPPYHYEWADNQTDFVGDKTFNLCKQWLAAGGPKVGGAAKTAAATDPVLGPRHLRNYGFTMAGYAEFKYKKGAGEIFEFTGGDDLWIFVDGVLAVDLGGTHQPAIGKADMDFLANNSHGCHPGDPLLDSCATKLASDGTWKDGSQHYLHFFYANRQTTGSDLRIRSSLSELTYPHNEQPSITRASVSSKDNGTRISILTNSALSESSISSMKIREEPSLLVVHKDDKAHVYGFYIKSIEQSNKGEAGSYYEITGELRRSNGEKVSSGVREGDLIAFNMPYDSEYLAKVSESYKKSLGSSAWDLMEKFTQKKVFSIKSESNKSVSRLPESLDEWATVVKTDSSNPIYLEECED